MSRDTRKSLSMRLARSAAMLVLAALWGGCAVGESTGRLGDPPEIVALSTHKVSVGDPLEIFGGNFVDSNDGHTELIFKGTFRDHQGGTYAVEKRIRPHWVDGNRVVWAQVGPFTNPFTNGEQLGAFQGDVTAVNVDADGVETRSVPFPTVVEFGESVVIRKLAPLRTDCAAPVKRLLGGFPYEIEVEAVGFTPTNFSYVISGETQTTRPLVFRRPATGQTDHFGSDGELVFAPVPEDRQFTLVNVTVSALGTDGKQRANSLVFAVHRPIEYMDSGDFKVAEVLPPKPITGCLAGGPTGRHVTLTETHTETRERTFGINWNEAWEESGSGTYSVSQAQTKGLSIQRNGSTTVTDTVGWYHEFGKEVGIEGSGSVGIKGIFEVGMKASGGLSWRDGTNGSHSEAYTNGWAVGRDYSTTDTESWAFTQTRGYALSKGGSDFWSVSSSDSESLAFGGDVLPGQFGVVYRQTVRIALPGALIAYDLCSNPFVVAQTNFIDYNWSTDLAVGGTCAPLPESRLPKAECFVTPCHGE